MFCDEEGVLARPSQYRACFVLDEAVDIDPDGMND